MDRTLTPASAAEDDLPLPGFSRFASIRILVLFGFHAVVFSSCYIFAWLVRFEFEMPAQYVGLMQSSLPFVVGIQLLVGALFGFYRGWWRYVGIADVIRLVLGMFTALAIVVMAWYSGTLLGLEERLVKAPRGVLLIDFAFALLMLFGARIAIRVGRDHLRPREKGVHLKRVIIIGAGDAGETLAREIEHRPQLGMRVVSFVDDHRVKVGASIRGIEVRGPISDVAKIADETGAEEALIAIPSASGSRMREIVHALAEADIEFKTIPGIDHLVSGRVVVSQLRPVNIEDLIRREKIEIPGDLVRKLFKGKRVMITGAGGTIGSELATQVLDFEPATLELVERSEFALYDVDKRLRNEKAWMVGVVRRHLADIRDEESMHALLAEAKPQIVLHAAAHKHVPLGEENALEYLRNNALATRHLAEMCEQAGVERLVFISTDKAINPTNVMGATKRAAEILLMDFAHECRMNVTAVRFGNVLGSSGSAVPLFMEQIAAGGPITVTHPEVTRYFLRPSEAISLVLQAAALAGERDGCVMMLDMGEPLKIADLARDLIELSGRDDIEIEYTGLRPGEKLFEEVRLDGESNEPTAHPQIVITRPPQPHRIAVARWIERASAANLHTAVVDLKQIVPEFIREASSSAPDSVAGSPKPSVTNAAYADS
jgi:FlaA1/EpsC-like NDP-sugar epimerase